MGDPWALLIGGDLDGQFVRDCFPDGAYISLYQNDEHGNRVDQINYKREILRFADNTEQLIAVWSDE